MLTRKQITIAAKMFELRDTMKRLHGNRWPEVVADLGTAIQLQMKATGNNNPLSAVLPIAKDMSKDGHSPALMMAVAVELADSFTNGEIPQVMKCNRCGKFTRTEDLTPEYNLDLLCESCLEKSRAEYL